MLLNNPTLLGGRIRTSGKTLLGDSIRMSDKRMPIKPIDNRWQRAAKVNHNIAVHQLHHGHECTEQESTKRELGRSFAEGGFCGLLG